MKTNWRKDNEMQELAKKDEELIARIKAGETLTPRELAYCSLHWSPLKQYQNLVRSARARKS